MVSVKIISSHNGSPSSDFVPIIFIQANSQERAADIGDIGKAVALQTTQGVVGSLAGPAMEVYRPVLGNLVQTAAQLRQRDIHRIGQMTFFIFIG